MRDVVIVSSWGRGAWLAHQLQKKAFRTTLFDISSLQPLSSAEREGPFGVFLPSHLSDLQKSYLCGDHFYSVQQGFSIFASQGPVEFRGALNPFLLETCRDFQVCHSVLHQTGIESRSSLPLSRGPVSLGSNKSSIKEAVRSNLFLYLAKEFSGSYTEQVRSVRVPLSLHPGKETYRNHNGFSPLFSEYLFRESSQRYFADIKYALQKEGVKWLDMSAADLSSSNNLLRDLKLKKTHIEFKWNEEVQKTRFLIWTLSGLETLQFFSNSMSFLFPTWKPPIKIWKRFSLSWDQGAFQKVIPLLLLVLPEYIRRDHVSHEHEQEHEQEPEPFLRWGEDFLSLKRHPEASKMDLWMLCPYDERFNKSILSSYLRVALDRLNCLLPGFSINGYLPEQEICHDYFVLYEKEGLFNRKKRDKKLYNRLFHLNPESAGKMDAYSLMRQSSDILESLLKNKA